MNKVEIDIYYKSAQEINIKIFNTSSFYNMVARISRGRIDIPYDDYWYNFSEKILMELPFIERVDRLLWRIKK